MLDLVENTGPEKSVSNPKFKGDTGIYSFASVVMLRSVEAMQAEIEGVRAAEDIECIHRMRVASRRLRSAMSVFRETLPVKKQAPWTRTIRDLTRALGEARDTDVQIELIEKVTRSANQAKVRPGLNRILLRLTQQRERLQKDVFAALNELEKSRVAAQIQSRYSSASLDSAQFTPALYQLAYSIINEKLNDFLSFEVYLRQPDNTAMLHAMRIAAKRLRYSMEIFAPIYADSLADPLQAARKSQQILGDVHDCDVWIAFLPGFEAKERERIHKFYGHNRPLYRITPGIEFFLQNRIDIRAAAYKEFLKVWRKWREQEIWLSLRETILIAVPEIPFTELKPASTGQPGSEATAAG